MTGLTDRVLRGLKPEPGKRKTISDTGLSGVRGLSILVNYGGTKVFYFRYKSTQGQLKRMRIGSYPGTSLADARRKARDYKKRIDDGQDLASLSIKSSLAKREIHTVQQLWSEYHQDSLLRKKSAKFENQLWNKHLGGIFGALDVRNFTRGTILDFLIPFRRAHSPALSARIQALISQLGSYAVERRVLEFSPAYQLGKKPKPPSKDRYLTRFELAKFWLALSDDQTLQQATVSNSLSSALKIALLTCARRGEVVGMQWSEIDLVQNIWTIPKIRTKNGKPHVVPLNEKVIEILRQAKTNTRRPNSRFVFPGRRREENTKGAGHIRGDAVTRACSRLCQTLTDLYELDKFTPHDLRRTAATYMASSLKVNRFTISQLLNHSSDHGGGAAITSVYARYDYLDEKNAALKAWATFVDKNAKSFF